MTDRIILTANGSILKEYYAKYLTDVRKLSKSSVKHYWDALNNISRRLKDKGLVENDIYEISNLEQLENIREILFNDSDFQKLNRDGHSMYSAGLNNYYRFASGEGFGAIKKEMQKLDVPVEPIGAVLVKQKVWQRSSILRVQALELADYKCEMDNAHITFIAANGMKPYMEGHHAIPMNNQNSFRVSLDVYANIVCLCPICHRKIHHGLKETRKDMIKKIYDVRGERLANSGIALDESEFIDVILHSDY